MAFSYVVFFCFFFLWMITCALLYIPGVTRIGREDAPIPQDIVVQGPGIEAEHCLIFNEGLCQLTLYKMNE